MIADSPMARGLLTGKVGMATVFPESDHRHANPAFLAESRVKLQPALDRARPIPEALGRPTFQATCPPSMEKVVPLT